MNAIPSVIIEDARLAPSGRAAEKTICVRPRSWPRATRIEIPTRPLWIARLTVLAVAALAASLTVYVIA